jgi:hypothetical protein
VSSRRSPWHQPEHSVIDPLGGTEARSHGPRSYGVKHVVRSRSDSGSRSASVARAAQATAMLAGVVTAVLNRLNKWRRLCRVSDQMHESVAVAPRQMDLGQRTADFK